MLRQIELDSILQESIKTLPRLRGTAKQVTYGLGCRTQAIRRAFEGLYSLPEIANDLDNLVLLLSLDWKSLAVSLGKSDRNRRMVIHNLRNFTELLKTELKADYWIKTKKQASGLELQWLCPAKAKEKREAKRREKELTDEERDD